MSAPKSGFLPLSCSQGRVPNWTLQGFGVSVSGHLQRVQHRPELQRPGNKQACGGAAGLRVNQLFPTLSAYTVCRGWGDG